MIARPLGTILGAGLRKACLIGRSTVVVPIPLHARRLRERGFNQAALLAQACAQTIRRPLVEHALHRSKETDVQASLGPKERFANMQDAFTVRHPDVVRNRSVVLVDDIYTTGATCTAASLALLRAGAKSVGIACVAVAVADRDLRPR